jgi:hypothetical protein
MCGVATVMDDLCRCGQARAWNHQQQVAVWKEKTTTGRAVSLMAKERCEVSRS